MKGNKENSFDVHEGNYRMKIVSGAVGVDRYGSERFRIVGDLISLPSRVYNYQAGINYKDGSTEMLPDLYKVMGAEVVNLVGEDGQILKEGLDCLQGKECDVQIVHISNPKHEKPFCKVARVTKPGVLVRDSGVGSF